jgi:hypothetical protein
MSARAVSQALLFSLAMVGVFSPSNALTQQELIAKLEAAVIRKSEKSNPPPKV